MKELSKAPSSSRTDVPSWNEVTCAPRACAARCTPPSTRSWYRDSKVSLMNAIRAPPLAVHRPKLIGAQNGTRCRELKSRPRDHVVERCGCSFRGAGRTARGDTRRLGDGHGRGDRHGGGARSWSADELIFYGLDAARNVVEIRRNALPLAWHNAIATGDFSADGGTELLLYEGTQGRISFYSVRKERSTPSPRSRWCCTSTLEFRTVRWS
jgi:hypothetical protein